MFVASIQHCFHRKTHKLINWMLIFLFLTLLVHLFVSWRRKSIRSRQILSYLRTNRHFVSMTVISKSAGFSTFVRNLKNMPNPAFVLLSNRHILELTFNHLCNTVNMKDVNSRLAIIALDLQTFAQLRIYYPNVQLFLFRSARLKNRIRCEYPFLGQYQLFFLFRANLAAALSNAGVQFWMTQQDTLWRSNLGDFNLELKYNRADVIVDRIGNDQMRLYRKMDGWINGATYFVRGNRNIMSSSDWLFTNRSRPPHFLQIDHLNSDEKLLIFNRNKLLFLNKDRRTCNKTLIENGIKLLENGTIFADHKMSRLNTVVESLIDLVLKFVPGSKNWYQKYMFLNNFYSRL